MRIRAILVLNIGAIGFVLAWLFDREQSWLLVFTALLLAIAGLIVNFWED